MQANKIFFITLFSFSWLHAGLQSRVRPLAKIAQEVQSILHQSHNKIAATKIQNRPQAMRNDPFIPLIFAAAVASIFYLIQVPDDPLHEACKANDVNAVRKILETEGTLEKRCKYWLRNDST